MGRPTIGRPTAPAALVRTDPPPIQTLHLWFHPDQYLRQLGLGGWRERTHPRAKSTTEWGGLSLHRVTLDLLFDGDRSPADVEADLALLESFARPVNPADPLSEPPRLQIKYGEGQQLRWVINDIVARSNERTSPRGPRVAARRTVDLLEYSTGAIAFTPLEQAEQQAQTQTGTTTGGALPLGRPAGGQPGRTYTVRAGDSLSTIAARELGDWRRWTDIATLNGLADPDVIVPGQVLRLPAS